MELKVSNYSISKLGERMPHRWNIDQLRHSNTGEITVKVETVEPVSAPKAVRFKMPIFTLRISYWLSSAAPCLVLGEPQAEVVHSPCKLLKTPPQLHFILDCGFHKWCQTFMALCGTGAGLFTQILVIQWDNIVLTELTKSIMLVGPFHSGYSMILWSFISFLPSHK